MEVTGPQPAIFRGRTDFLDKGHFDRQFTCDRAIYKRRAPQGKISVFLLQDTPKTAFQWGI